MKYLSFLTICLLELLTLHNRDSGPHIFETIQLNVRKNFIEPNSKST